MGDGGGVAGAVGGWGGRVGTVARADGRLGTGQVDWGGGNEGVRRGWAAVAMVSGVVVALVFRQSLLR